MESSANPLLHTFQLSTRNLHRDKLISFAYSVAGDERFKLKLPPRIMFIRAEDGRACDVNLNLSIRGDGICLDCVMKLHIHVGKNILDCRYSDYPSQPLTCS